MSRTRIQTFEESPKNIAERLETDEVNKIMD
jgi:hypothetical protein